MDDKRGLDGEVPAARNGPHFNLVGEFRRRLGRVDWKRLSDKHLKPALIVALALFVLLLAVWSKGYPIGTDAWGHIAKAEHLVAEMRENGLGAFFSTSWLPNWYMGDPFRTFYPPLTLLLLTPLAFLTHDPGLTHKLFTTLALTLFAVLSYVSLYRISDTWPAAFGSVLAIWAPYQLRTLFFEGNYPRILALLALPPIVLFTERLMNRSLPKMQSVVPLAICWAWAILAHPQQALMFAVGFMFYIVMRLFIDPDIPLKWAGWWVLSLVAGVLLISPWVLPAYGRGEIPQVPYLPPEKVSLFSTSLDAILPLADVSDGHILFGFGVIVMALLSVTARPNKLRTAWVSAAIITIWLSLGPKGVLFSLLPLNTQLLPERFLNFSVFALAIGASGLFPIGNRARLARILIVLGAVFIDVFPGWRLAAGHPYPEAQSVLTQVDCPQNQSDCRLALFTYPEPNALEVYFAGQDDALINGWALENTPHHRALRRVLSATEWSPEYLQHLLSLWNVGVAVVGGERVGTEKARAALDQIGFELERTEGAYEVWVHPQPTGMLQRIPRERMLVLGDELPPFLMAYPFAEEAREQVLSHLDEGVLPEYAAVGFYRFEQATDALIEDEVRIREYVQDGGRVILDLSGMEVVFGRTLDFLDVNVLRLMFPEAMLVRWADELGDLPTALPLDIVAPEGWSGAVYQGLDEVFAEVKFGEDWYPILGYKDLGDGRAWFVGLNILYYAQQGGHERIVEAIRALTLEGTDLSHELRLESVAYTDLIVGGSGLSLLSESDEPLEDVVLSYTYSPRWRVSVDGEEVPFEVYENLIQLSLPEGKHAMRVEYRLLGTLWPILGLILGALAVVALSIGTAVERRTFIPLPEEAAPHRITDQDQFAPCLTCGFLFAHLGPPTPITYPFQTVNCAICGQRMDDEGFQPGQVPSLEERDRKLADWLLENGYDPQVVHEKWGFRKGDFFGESGDALRVAFPMAGDDGDG